jgi:hypothetical protein
MGMDVTESTGSFNSAIAKCATMNESGKTIGIVNVTGINMMWVSLVAKLLGYIPILILFKFQTPFGFLPGERFGIEWMRQLEQWEAFSVFTWFTLLILYTVWVAVSFLRSNLHRGIPGVDQIFARYGKVVRTVKPGEGWVNIDPRVQPTAVVSRKPLLMDLDPIESPAKENVKIETHGTIVFRVNDSFLLFEQGGFKTFFEQMNGLYASLQRDRILQSSARTFNQFMIEPARCSHDGTTSIDRRLERLEATQLSIRLVNEMSEIGELDLSKMGLVESDDPERRRILPSLNGLASRYGIEIIDYIPQGNLVEADFFGQLAVDLVRSIQRLHQATNILADTLRQEIDQEITARVSHIKRGGLEIDRLCGELESVKGALEDPAQQQKVIGATEKQMKGIVDAILAEYLARVEGLMSRIASNQINVAGIERFIGEYEMLLKSLEDGLITALPKVGRVVVDGLQSKNLVAETDIVELILNHSGIMPILEELKKSTVGREDLNPVEDIKTETEKLKSGSLIQRIQKELNEVSLSTGLNMDQYAPTEIQRKIEEIETNAGTSSIETANSAI